MPSAQHARGLDATTTDVTLKIPQHDDPVHRAFEQGLIGLGDTLLIDTLCRLANAQGESCQRLRQILALLAAALRQGSLCLSLDKLTADLATVLADFRMDLREGHYAAIVGKPGEYKPLILEEALNHNRLYTQRTFKLECEVAALLAGLLVTPAAPEEWNHAGSSPGHALAPGAIDSALQHILVTHPLRNAQGTPLDFSGTREAALRESLSHRIFAITGGPGTGKTSLSANLLRLHQLLFGPNLRIALAAPTGRAAARLTDSLRQSLAGLGEQSGTKNPPWPELEATTLHRLLGYEQNTHRFRRDEHLPIEADLILVDESSMVDLQLFRALLRAIPAKARLILLGDADQLPSVEAGSLLADLGPRRATTASSQTLPPLLPWAQLSGSHRSEPPLTLAAESVFQGDTGHIHEEHFPGVFADKPQGATLWPHTRGKHSSAWDTVVTTWLLRHAPSADAVAALRKFKLDPDESRQASLDWRHDDERSLALSEMWTHFKHARLLAVLRQGPEGVSGLNAFASRFFKATYDPDAPRQVAPAEARFFHGAPILLQRNDFERGLANGDMGLALRLDERLWVAFETQNGFRLWPLAVLPDPDLAFATTVHKSQGSEYEEILLVLPPGEHPLLAREVVYTALTRAKKAAFLLGDRQSLQFAVNRSSQRESGLRERLLGQLEKIATPHADKEKAKGIAV